jgi:ribosomal protein S12 methylthiotransferase accessory factor
MAKMTVTFPGGKKVDAEYRGVRIQTDQPVKAGGDGSAPAPFDLFLASIATCAGIYVKAFCDARDLPTEGLGMTMDVVHDHEAHRIARLAIEIRLPEGFPETHRAALVRAADQCSVKKHMLAPPEFEIRTV